MRLSFAIVLREGRRLSPREVGGGPGHRAISGPGGEWRWHAPCVSPPGARAPPRPHADRGDLKRGRAEMKGGTRWKDRN